MPNNCSCELFGNSERFKVNGRIDILQERGFTEKDWQLFRNKIADWQEACGQA
jgi:hypothetical protein